MPAAPTARASLASHVTRKKVATIGGLMALAIGGLSCNQPPTPSPATSPSAGSSAAPAPPTAAVTPQDAGPHPYEGPWVGATVLHAPIWSEMEPVVTQFLEHEETRSPMRKSEVPA